MSGRNTHIVSACVLFCFLIQGSLFNTAFALSLKKSEVLSKDTREKLFQVKQRYERLLEKCTDTLSERCADILFDLAKIYYDIQRDTYVQELNTFEREIEAWERRPEGEKPVHPIPDYTRSLETYLRLIEEYPVLPRIDQVYYQVGNLYMLRGEVDSSKNAFQSILTKTPNSRIASAAHFRIADYCYMNNHFRAALKHLNLIKQNDVTAETWELALYRKGECYQHLAEFDRAVEHFFDYVEKCDAGTYVRQELREEALENMAAAFADMPDGASEAVAFFNKYRDRPYEAQLLYTIGMKNRNHGQYEQAVISLQTALKKHPWYIDAPQAHYSIVECLVIKKKYEEANNQRIKLVKKYMRGNRWYSKNRRNKQAVAFADEYSKKALGTIGIHFHAGAQKKRQRSLFEQALKYYTKFIDAFPDDKWKTYEYRYNMAEIYNELKQYKKAAYLYWQTATEDISSYPPRKQEDIDEHLYDDPTELEKEKKKRTTTKGKLTFSPADAGNNAIVVLNKLRNQIQTVQQLSEKEAFYLPITQEILKLCVAFRKLFPSHPNTPNVIYLSATIRYNAKAYEDALKDFSIIVTDYASSEVAKNAAKMIAKTFTMVGKYDWALTEYRELLQQAKPETKEYKEIIDLAAGVLYKKAERERNYLLYRKAAAIFTLIVHEFPESNISDRALFDGAACYEKAGQFDIAAQTFLALPKQYTRSPLREKAFFRAAESYKKIDQWDNAASTFEKGAHTIAKADYAIPGFSSAAQCYQKTNEFARAGTMYEQIADRYPADSRAPLALYNAGLMYQQGKEYDRAVQTYQALIKRYSTHEYANDGAFAIGSCYRKAEKMHDAAVAFMAYGSRYPQDSKAIVAYNKAGMIYYQSAKLSEAKKSFYAAVAAYPQSRKVNDTELALAQYMIGEIFHHKCNEIPLTGGSVRGVRDNLKRKTALLEKALKHYALAIKTGVRKWVLKANYQIGMCFVHYAEDEKNQQVFAKNKQERMATTIEILKNLEQYYHEAQNKFTWNVQKGKKDKISDPYIDSSAAMFIQMAYMQGQLFEEIAAMI